MASLAERTRGRRPTGVRHDDADETVGTVDSDDAAGFDPLPVLRALHARRAPAVVIGQVAGILHGSTELTGDLDLLWSGLPGDAPAMAAAFGDLDAELTDDDGGAVDVSRAFLLAKVQFRTRTAAGDCCTPRLPWNGPDVAAFTERAATAEIDGVIVRYLSVPDLIAMRRATGRPKDLRRALELERLTGVFDARRPGSSGGPRLPG